MPPAQLMSRVMVVCLAFMAIASAESLAGISEVAEIVPESGEHALQGAPAPDGTYQVTLSGKTLGMLEAMMRKKKAAQKAGNAKASASSTAATQVASPKDEAQRPASHKAVPKKAQMTKKVMAMLAAMMKKKEALHHKVVHSQPVLHKKVAHHPHKNIKKIKKQKKKIHVHRLKNGAAMLHTMVATSVHRADAQEKHANEVKAKKKAKIQKEKEAAEAKNVKKKVQKKASAVMTALNTMAAAKNKKIQKEKEHKHRLKDQLREQVHEKTVRPNLFEDDDLPLRRPTVDLKALPAAPLSSVGKSLLANLKSVSRENKDQEQQEAAATKRKQQQAAKKAKEAKKLAAAHAKPMSPMEMMRVVLGEKKKVPEKEEKEAKPKVVKPKLGVVDQALMDAASALTSKKANAKPKAEEARKAPPAPEEKVDEVPKLVPQPEVDPLSEEEAFSASVERKMSKERHLKAKRRQQESMSMAALSETLHAPRPGDDADIAAGKLVAHAKHQMKSDLGMTPEGQAQQHRDIQNHIATHVTPVSDDAGGDDDEKAAAMAMTLFKKLGGQANMSEEELKAMVQAHVANEMKANPAAVAQQKPAKKATPAKVAPVKAKPQQALIQKKLKSAAADIVQDLKHAGA